MKKLFLTICLILVAMGISAQEFTEQDTLRGSITPERAWWDLTYYHLDIEVRPDEKFILGSNLVGYNVLEEKKVLQIDLQPPLQIEKVTQDGKSLKVTSNGNAHFIKLKKKQKKGTYNELIIHYSGHPKEAVRAPWDGGFSWKKDGNGKHFVATSCQGLGASVWWPNKDHMYDEVDSMKLSINVDKDLVAVGNGRLEKVEKHKNKTKTYHWTISNPINNYSVNFNIGNYVQFSEVFNGEKGPLDCTYYVLEQDLEKAKEQFKQVPKMLEAFEYWFGPYPFYEDSYKLVAAPYSGMEHQSAITYGNGYKNGYRGNDASNTGWGDKFDFIIIHESGHEWFANNITFKDIADIWIHESFTNYSESLFVEYHFGKEAGTDYQIGLRRGISNDKPMIGNYLVNDVNYSGDNYPKGSTVLHMLRQIVNDDVKWRKVLRGLGSEFYHQTVTTEQIENYISKEIGLDLTIFWNQYLRTAQIPVFEYYFVKGHRALVLTLVTDNNRWPGVKKALLHMRDSFFIK